MGGVREDDLLMNQVGPNAKYMLSVMVSRIKSLYLARMGAHASQNNQRQNRHLSPNTVVQY
jgi:hypothetical protein